MEYHEIPATIALELIARSGILNRYFEARIGKPLRYPLVGRVANTVLEILAQHQEGTVGIVAHGGVISSLLSWYFPQDRKRWWRETVENCSLMHLRIADGRAELVAFGQVTHLAPANDGLKSERSAA